MYSSFDPSRVTGYDSLARYRGAYDDSPPTRSRSPEPSRSVPRRARRARRRNPTKKPSSFLVTPRRRHSPSPPPPKPSRAPVLETPPYNNDLSVQDRSCNMFTKSELRSTKEYTRVVNKTEVESMTKAQLCATLKDIARTPSSEPIVVEMAHITQRYKEPAPSRAMPVNRSLLSGGNGTILCANTGKPIEGNQVVLIGPYADGPTGLCDTRHVLMGAANQNARPAPNGMMYTTVGEAIPYWFTLTDAELFADPRYSIYGVRESKRLADGSVLAKVVPMRDASDVAKFVTDPNRLLPTASSVAAEAPASKLPNWAEKARGTPVRQEPFPVNPLGHEGKVCVNDVNMITQYSWAEDESTDRIALYEPDQRLNPGAKDTLTAYCYTRPDLMGYLGTAQAEYVDTRSGATVAKLPYPLYYLDSRALELLRDRSLHSFVIKKVGISGLREKQNQYDSREKTDTVYTLEPIRTEADVARFFMS